VLDTQQTRTHKHTNTQTHKHTNTQTHKHTNIQTHKHTHTPTCKLSTTSTLTTAVQYECHLHGYFICDSIVPVLLALAFASMMPARVGVHEYTAPPSSRVNLCGGVTCHQYVSHVTNMCHTLPTAVTHHQHQPYLSTHAGDTTPPLSPPPTYLKPHTRRMIWGSIYNVCSRSSTSFVRANNVSDWARLMTRSYVLGGGGEGGVGGW